MSPLLIYKCKTYRINKNDFLFIHRQLPELEIIGGKKKKYINSCDLKLLDNEFVLSSREKMHPHKKNYIRSVIVYCWVNVQNTLRLLWVSLVLPLSRLWVVHPSGLTQEEGRHISSDLLSHQACNQSSQAKPGKLERQTCISAIQKRTVKIVNWNNTYFDFCLIWSFIRIRHFGPLFLPLPVCLHNSTEKGTFVL